MRRRPSGLPSRGCARIAGMNRWAAVVFVIAAGSIAAAAATGQLAERPLAGALKHPAIDYYSRPTHDLVSALDRRIADGTLHLDYEDGSGYLRPVLNALHLAPESQ